MKKGFSALAAMIWIVACENNLSGPRAEEILRSRFRDQRFLELTPRLADAGIRNGLLSRVRDKTWGDEDLVMGPVGSRYFESARGAPMSTVDSPNVIGLGAQCFLRQPLQRQITQIISMTSQGSPAIQEVRFNWKYGAIPEGLAPIVHNVDKPYPGKALMRLERGYWRLVDSSLMYSFDGETWIGGAHASPPGERW